MAYKPYPRLSANLPATAPASAGVPAVDEALLRSTTAKRLKPGLPGTKRLQEYYGNKLLCVRYRIDPDTGRRFTTVELVVEERDGPPAKEVWVRVGYGETNLRQRIKEAGGIWDGNRKLWRVSGSTAKTLGLLKRIVKNTQ